MDKENKVADHPGKRLAPSSHPAWHKGALILLAVVVLLLVLYAALCLWVALGGRILPGVHVGTCNVGNQPLSQAQSTLQQTLSTQLSATTVTLTYGEGQSAQLPGTLVQVDASASAQAAYAVGRETTPVLYGARFLAGLFQPTALLPTLTLDTPALQTTLDDIFAGAENPPTQTLLAVGTDSIRLVKGAPGVTYNREKIAAQLLEVLPTYLLDQPNNSQIPGSPTLPVEPSPTDPDPVDWVGLAQQIKVDVRDATLDPETYEIQPSVTGVALDTALAAELYDAADWGATITIPLVLTEPQVTTESLEASLFKDLLGEATSRVTGSAARLNNVAKASELINGKILLPGEVFSYNGTTGERTADKGFLPAPAYVNGLTVNQYGGGVCQPSSTLYYATLMANLKIVERHNHAFAVGYVPDGLDATVDYGNLDYRFENNTNAPVKVVADYHQKNGAHWLTMQLYGTKPDDTKVKMDCIRLSTTNYETVYKPDPSVPAGTTKVSITPYTGRKVEAYRCIYAADGTLLSRTLENVSTYHKRDKVILYNPADAHLYAPESPAPSPTPTPSTAPTTEPTPTPSATPAVVPTAVPEATPTPDVPPEFTPEPTQTVEPTQTPAPDPTPVPVTTLPAWPSPEI